MIVCSCNVLSDQAVRAALGGGEGPRTTGEVYGCLGCSAQCGRCARTIRRIIDEALAATAERDVERRWLGGQGSRASGSFDELPKQPATLEAACEPSMVGSL